MQYCKTYSRYIHVTLSLIRFICFFLCPRCWRHINPSRNTYPARYEIETRVLLSPTNSCSFCGFYQRCCFRELDSFPYGECSCGGSPSGYWESCTYRFSRDWVQGTKLGSGLGFVSVEGEGSRYEMDVCWIRISPQSIWFVVIENTLFGPVDSYLVG